MPIEAIICLVSGLFSVAAATFNWDWFFNNSSAVIITKILRSRNNARIFYGVIGIVLIIISKSY